MGETGCDVWGKGVCAGEFKGPPLVRTCCACVASSHMRRSSRSSSLSCSSRPGAAAIAAAWLAPGEARLAAACAARSPPLGSSDRNGVKARGARETIDQRRAVQQQTRAERTQHEVFQAGLGRSQGVAVEGGEDVQRHRCAHPQHRANLHERVAAGQLDVAEHLSNGLFESKP